MRERIDHSRNEYIGEVIDILCAVLNRYFKPLSVDTAARNAAVDRILSHQNDREPEGYLLCNQSEIWAPCVSGRRASRGNALFIKDHMLGVPVYSKKDILSLSMGPFTYKKSFKYIKHWVNKMIIQRHKQRVGVYRFVYVLSAHKDSRTTRGSYEVVVDFTNNDRLNANVPEGNRLDYMHEQCKYYCTGPSGARTINPCAHIVAILVMIWLIRSNMWNSVLINVPHPIDCHLYNEYLKTHPTSYFLDPPKPPQPNNNNEDDEKTFILEDEYDESDKCDAILAGEMSVSPPNNCNTNNNNTNNSNNSDDGYTSSDNDEINGIVFDPNTNVNVWHIENVNTNVNVSHIENVAEYQSDAISSKRTRKRRRRNNCNDKPEEDTYECDQSDLDEEPPSKKKRYNTRSGKN